MRRLAAVAVACLLVLAGCGAASHPRRLAGAPACPVGNSFMGCATAPTRLAPRNLTIPPGRRFIDVSDWQPTVNWSAVRAAGIFGVVVKAGEGLRADPTFTEHVAGARAVGLQVQAYWFVRPSGCAAESAVIRAHSAGLPVTLDIEVPGIAGYAFCLRSVARDVYTSPGTWPGGSNGGLPLWQAEYGPALHPVWQPVKAWQFTDAAPVAGLRLDESVDFGLFVMPKPRPAGVACFHRRESKAACATARAKVASDQRAVAASLRALAPVTADLRAHGCRVPYRRGVCVRAGRRARLFLGRVSYFTAAGARIKAAN